MTLCELIKKPITRMVEEEGKNLDEIAEEVCPSVAFGREKIIRVIKDFFGEEYLIQHAETLKYDVGKAQLAKKRKTRSHKNIDATTDTVIESNSVMPCQSVNTEHRETGHTKGQEQVIEEHDKPAACCQERKKTVFEEETQYEVQDIAVDELDNATPNENEFNELVWEIKRLISKHSLEDVKKAVALATIE